MGNKSLQLQAQALADMAKRKPFVKKLAGFEYEVLPKVYKGSTDSELLCSLLDIRKDMDVWDIGTGTGLAALTAKKLGAHYVLATDLNPDAVKNARANSARLHLNIDVKKANVFGDSTKKFDLITFNPPFTDNTAKASHEISFWDKDHKAVRAFFKDIRSHLKENGRALICWSSFGKTAVLKRIASEYGHELYELGRRKGKMSFVYYVFEVK